MKPQHRNARKIFLSFDSNASYQLVPLFHHESRDFVCILKYCAIIIDNKKISLKIFIHVSKINGTTYNSTRRRMTSDICGEKHVRAFNKLSREKKKMIGTLIVQLFIWQFKRKSILFTFILKINLLMRMQVNFGIILQSLIILVSIEFICHN